MSFKSFIDSTKSMFAPADDSSPSSIDLPTNEPFRLAVHFANMSIIFSVTKDGANAFFHDLQDPYCKGFNFQRWWVNKDLICGVEILDGDSQTVHTDQDSQRGEQLGALAQETPKAYNSEERSNPNLTTAAEWDKIACKRDPMPRGTSHIRQS